MTKTTRPLLLAALITGLAGSAFAQAQPAPRKVDRNELRACLDGGDAIKERNEALKARAAKARALQDELKVEGDEISEQIKRQENGTGASIGVATGGGRDRLERRKTAYSRKAEAAKAEAQTLQPEAEQLNKDLDAYNARCNGISFDREDREAVDKERAAAGKK